VDGQIEVVGPGGGAVVRVLARIGADIGAETRAAGIGIEPAASTGAEAVAGTGPATAAEVAVDKEPETDAEVTVDTELETGAEVAVETTPKTEAPADDHVRGPEGAPALTKSADRTKPRRKLSRDSALLIAAWTVAIVTPLAGLVQGGYTGQTWYDHLKPYLSPASAIATPLALLGLQLARAPRSRMVTAIAVACTGVVSVVVATALMVHAGVVRQELAVELAGASLVTALGLIFAARAYRAVSSGPARAGDATTILMVAMFVPALVASAVSLVIYPLVAGVCAVSGLLALGLLLLPLQSRGRVVLGAVFIGLLLTVMLYAITPKTLSEAILLPVGCVVFSAVAFFHVRPFWRALDSRGS
jgi:hypothetical protein